MESKIPPLEKPFVFLFGEEEGDLLFVLFGRDPESNNPADAPLLRKEVEGGGGGSTIPPRLVEEYMIICSTPTEKKDEEPQTE